MAQSQSSTLLDGRQASAPALAGGAEQLTPRADLGAARVPLLVALALHLLLLFVLLRSFDFNPTGPIRMGDRFDGSRFWTPASLVQPGIGYDGQFFYYLAHDPFLRWDDPEAFLDHPAYRYGRILYPLLAWLGALGQPGALPWSLLAVNLLAGALGTLAAVSILRTVAAPPLLALGYALSPPVVLGLIANLAEPTALALFALGLALVLRRHHGRAGLALGLATLARESTALVSLGFALHACVRRSWREAVCYLAPLGIPLAWHLWVWARLGALPSTQSPPNFGPPLSGALYRAGVLLSWRPSLVDEAAPANPWPELLIVLVTVAVIGAGLARFARRRDPIALQVFIHAAAALCTTPMVWIGLGSYARVLGPLYLLYGLSLLVARRPSPSTIRIAHARRHGLDQHRRPAADGGRRAD